MRSPLAVFAIASLAAASACAPSDAPPAEAPPSAREVPAAAAGAVPAELVRLTLLADEPQRETLEVAARFEIAEGWHIYWINPGDSGLETKVSFKGPSGAEVGPTRFPAPQRFTGAGDLQSFGYERETMVFAQILNALGPAPVGAVADRTITAEASWLACAQVCVRGKATAQLKEADLNRATMQEATAAMAPHRARLPKPWGALGALKWSPDGEGGVLEVGLPAGGAAKAFDFFPGPSPSPALTEKRVQGDVLRLRYREPEQPDAAVSGVLALGTEFYQLDTPWPGAKREHP